MTIDGSFGIELCNAWAGWWSRVSALVSSGVVWGLVTLAPSLATVNGYGPLLVLYGVILRIAGSWWSYSFIIIPGSLWNNCLCQFVSTAIVSEFFSLSLIS